MEVLADVTRMLNREYGIAHATLQPEPAHARQAALVGCSLDTPEGPAACLVAFED
jgi:hypothetical protein